jgi:glycosyltransferase involved in cell wall biosynthesis
LLPENLTAQLSFLPKAIRTWANDCIWKDLAKVYNQVPIIATPSLVGVTLLHANGIHQRVKVVTSGVDLVRFTNSQENCAVREKYKIPDLPTYMYVGRLDAEKHIGELIKALPLVLEKVDAQLVIAGTGELEGDLTRFARKQKVTARVIFTGFVDYEDLPRVYSACDVFCIAGSAELQSMVALEAMAMSKPIMAARATALPALIREGVNGYTFELGNSQDLADRLIELLTDPSKCEAMGKRSFEMVAAHSVERTIAAYGELYKTAIQGNALRK